MILVWTAGWGYYEDTNSVGSCRDKMKNRGKTDACAGDTENSIVSKDGKREKYLT
jgi:hypothetical protein